MKILLGMSLDYLKELVAIKEIFRYNLLSNNGLLLEIPSIKSKNTLGIASLKWQLRPYGTNCRTIYVTKLILANLNLRSRLILSI